MPWWAITLIVWGSGLIPAYTFLYVLDRRHQSLDGSAGAIFFFGFIWPLTVVITIVYGICKFFCWAWICFFNYLERDPNAPKPEKPAKKSKKEILEEKFNEAIHL